MSKRIYRGSEKEGRKAFLLAYIKERAELDLAQPSIREMGEALHQAGFAQKPVSTSVINYYLRDLVDDGLLKAERGIARTWRLPQPLQAAKSQTQLVRIPIIGKLRADQPIPTN